MKSVKFIRLVFVLLSVSLLASGCMFGQVNLIGSGKIVTQQEEFTKFDALVISDGFQVGIRQGEAFSVTIRADDNVQKYLQVVQKEDILYIGLDPNYRFNKVRLTLQAEIVMPYLASLNLSGGGQGQVTGISSAFPLNLGLSGGSTLTGDVTCGDASFDLTGGSQLTLAGAAQSLRLAAAGGSTADLAGMKAVDVTLNASGGSTATVWPTGKLDVTASGSSQVYYIGEPILGSKNLSGSSKLQRK